ncbi:MAG: hypothetical protein Q9170_004600 [Blastenia crenularia]
MSPLHAELLGRDQEALRCAYALTEFNGLHPVLPNKVSEFLQSGFSKKWTTDYLKQQREIPLKRAVRKQVADDEYKRLMMDFVQGSYPSLEGKTDRVKVDYGYFRNPSSKKSDSFADLERPSMTTHSMTDSGPPSRDGWIPNHFQKESNRLDRELDAEAAGWYAKRDDWDAETSSCDAEVGTWDVEAGTDVRRTFWSDPRGIKTSNDYVKKMSEREKAELSGRS